MTLYHKWDVKNDFAYVLQFFSLISDSLGSVKGNCIKFRCHTVCGPRKPIPKSFAVASFCLFTLPKKGLTFQKKTVKLHHVELVFFNFKNLVTR